MKRVAVLSSIGLIVLLLGLYGYMTLSGHVWLSSSNILSRVAITQTLILRRSAIQQNGPHWESYGDNIYVFDQLPDRPWGFYRYKSKIPLRDLKPLRLLAGDVDGDGLAELSVMVYKSTLFDPQMSKRPFFYRYAGGVLYPLWLGSRLSRPFENYELWDDGGGVMKLLTAEYLADGGMALGLYEWDSFGFVRVAQSDRYDKLILPPQERVGIISVTGSDDQPLFFYYDGADALKEGSPK